MRVWWSLLNSLNRPRAATTFNGLGTVPRREVHGTNPASFLGSAFAARYGRRLEKDSVAVNLDAMVSIREAIGA